MSNRQARRRQAHEATALHLPVEPAATRDLMAWICLGCWDGVVPIPPYRDGTWVDVGIDLFYNDDNFDGRGIVQPVKRNHVCPGTKYVLADPAKAALLKAMFPNGNWHKQVLRISLLSYDKLVSTGYISAGSPTIDPR